MYARGGGGSREVGAKYNPRDYGIARNFESGLRD